MRSSLTTGILAWIAAASLAILTLSACIDDADGPRLSVDSEGLGEGIWVIADMGDFNDDGADDLLWNDPGKSMMAVWLMAGTEVLLPGELTPGPPGAPWNAAWAADFNADDMADVRWYNNVDETTAIWLMSSTELVLAGEILPGPAGKDWTRVSSTDFNNDGMADLLWRNKVTRGAEVWLMNSTKLFLAGPEIPPPPGDGWIVSKTGDFNADQMGDILWYNPQTGFYSIELMAATQPLLRGPELPGPLGVGWRPVLGTDFNADGMADVLWYNPTSQTMAVWLMNGTELLLAGPEIPGPPGDGWLPATTGDVNVDGMADVAWENPAARRFCIWLMAGTEVLLRGPEIPGPGGP